MESLDDGSQEAPADAEGSAGEEQTDTSLTLLAPTARFRGARRSLGEYARNGDSRELRRALGHYVRTGYGGSGTMNRRLGGTGATANRLGGVLRSGRMPDGTELRDAIIASGSDVNIVLDAIADAASPIDGTQDKEASRRAVRDSLSELLVKYPDADLAALTDDQRMFVIERYAALDVYGRFCLDLQKTVLEKASDAATGLRRMKSIRDFVVQQVAAAFRAVRERGSMTDTKSIARLTSRALQETLSVFEEYTT
ncbi:Qat anti-phage system associated protein QatB [Paenarthrobacter sp. NPDC058040]|uniref:Qat anti-phage system associated protein QatB n=1 Tax=unclassified Paenarthrobacter TaxID=2634190 RepID=UPI0036DD3CF6